MSWDFQSDWMIVDTEEEKFAVPTARYKNKTSFGLNDYKPVHMNSFMLQTFRLR